MLQCVAVCCSVLQRELHEYLALVKLHFAGVSHESAVLQHVAVYCSVLQRELHEYLALVKLHFD